MRVFRFGFSVFTNLIMSVIGGFLLYLGGVGLLLTSEVYADIETGGAGLTSQANELLGPAGLGQMDGLAAAMPWLIIFGQLMTGLLLILFGILGLKRRLLTAFPDEDETLPATSGHRLGQVGVSIVSGLLGGFLMISTLVEFVDCLRVKLHNESTQAVVEKNWKSIGAEGETRGAYYAIYRFRNRDGESIRSKVEVPNFGRKFFVEGKRIIVSYQPGNPQINEWEGIRSIFDFILPILLYSLLLLGGIWGLKRNLYDTPKLVFIGQEEAGA